MLFRHGLAGLTHKAAAGGTWVPSDDAGLYATVFAHYDAEVLASVIDTTTAGLVETWEDQSAAGFDITQSGTSRPANGTNTLTDGSEVIQFDGLNDSLTSAATGPLGSGSQTFFAIGVAKVGTIPGTGRDVLFGYGDGSDQYIALGLADNAGTGRVGLFFGNGNATSSTVPVAGDETIFSVSHTAADTHADIVVRVNGETITMTPSAGANTISFSGTDDLRLGVRNTGGDPFTGGIREMMFFDTIPSDANREKIEGYMAHINGIEANLDGTHPYKSSAP